MARPKLLQKQQAKYLYFSTPRTQREIADAIGVTPKALSHWVRKEGWAEEKKKIYYSPEQILHQLYEQIRQINENIARRDEGLRYGTKEELEANTKILALITSTIKNTQERWRDIAPDFDLKVTAGSKENNERDTVGIDLVNDDGTFVGNIKAGDIPMGGKLPDGRYVHDEKTMHAYYMHIGSLIAMANQSVVGMEDEPSMHH